MSILRLKDILAEKGISSKYLSEKVGVTPATISNINNGNHFPKQDLLLKLAEVLQVDVKDLFHSTKTKPQEPIYIEKDGKYIKIGELKPDLKL